MVLLSRLAKWVGLKLVGSVVTEQMVMRVMLFAADKIKQVAARTPNKIDDVAADAAGVAITNPAFVAEVTAFANAFIRAA